MSLKYDFNQVIPRQGTDCLKWDGLKEHFPDCPEAIPLWVADMDFACPQEIVEAVKERASHPIYGYAYAGDEVREIIAGWKKRRNNWTVNPQCITFSSGVVPSICATVRAFSNPGDSVIIQTPVYYPFMNSIIDNGRNVLENPLLFDGENWRMDIEGFRKAAERPESKIFLLCNPHNPVGRVFTKEELLEIGQICAENQVLIFSDEIHSDLVFEGHKHIPIASLSEEIADITITAFSPSKTFNIAGLQASAVIIDNEGFRKRFDDEMDRTNFLISIFSVTALKTAYSGCEDYLEQLLEYLWDNYLFVDEFLKANTPKIKCQKPEGTYLLWLDCRELGFETTGDLKSFFLQKAHVALDEGIWFGSKTGQYMRMNIGCPRVILEKALEQIKKAYEEYDK